MSRVVLCLLLITGNVMYGMEKRKWQMIRSACFATHPKISVVQDDIYNRRTKSTDIIVVGKVEQKILKRIKFYDYGCVGDVTCPHDDNIATKSYCDSLHDKSKTGQASKIKKNKNSCSSIITKELDSRVVYVFEPQLLFEEINYKNAALDAHYKNKVGYQYGVLRRFDKKTEYEEYYEYAALQEARKDLGICYTNVLEKAHEFFIQHHTTKSIAFTALSTSLGFPVKDAIRVAVVSVLGFIKNSSNKDTYGLIEFVVSKKEDFFFYMKVLEEQGVKCNSYDEEKLSFD